MLNVYVGLGLLSKPYAIAKSWLSVLLAIASVTGKLIVRGFQKLPKSDEGTYAKLGELAFGAFGRRLVHFVVFAECCGALMVILIFVWKNALLLAPWYLPDAIISERTVALVTAFLATPTVWALDFGAMVLVAQLGVIASVIIVGVIVGVAVYYALQISFSGAALPALTLPLVQPSVSMSIGIFVLSLGGHAALPGIYASMAEPHKFDRMLDISIAAMFLIYASVGLAGYLAYGWLKGDAAIDILITTNMAHDRAGIVPLELPGEVGERTMSLESTIMTIAVVAKSFTAISPVTSLVADLPELVLLGEATGATGAAAAARRCQQQRIIPRSSCGPSRRWPTRAPYTMASP